MVGSAYRLEAELQTWTAGVQLCNPAVSASVSDWTDSFSE